jgi:hypothetical protein
LLLAGLFYPTIKLPNRIGFNFYVFLRLRLFDAIIVTPTMILFGLITMLLTASD